MEQLTLTREIIARIEALEIECDGVGENDCTELVRLNALLGSVKGDCPAAIKWRGKWYPKAISA